MFLFSLNILLFNIFNEQLFEALFYGCIIAILILIVIIYYSLSGYNSLRNKIKEYQQSLDHSTFEIGSLSKQIINYDIKIGQYQKQAEEAQKKIQELSIIFSDQNVILEKEVRKQTQKISEANESLQKVVEELDMFIYKTAHDIRGPLARLIGLSNLALVDVQDPAGLDYLKKLAYEANHLNSILKRLSTIYEINHSDLYPEKFSLNEVINNTISELGTPDDITIETFIEPGLEIKAD